METIINKGYQFKIVPTELQKEFFLKSFGCARKLYNHYVDTLYTGFYWLREWFYQSKGDSIGFSGIYEESIPLPKRSR